MDIQDKVALVTGGASGIGLACVKELLNNGARGVTIVDINDAGHGIAKELNKTFTPEPETLKVIFAKADVADKTSLDGAFKATIDTFKNLDIVMNNAGIVNEINWELCYDINLKGVANGLLLALEHYLPKYKSSPDAIIVNTSSIAGLEPWAAIPHYTATKFGVIGLTLSFGGDFHFKRTGVRVAAICPDATHTVLIKKLQEGVIFGDHMDECVQASTFQHPSSVAEAFIYAIKEGRSGSIHVVKEGNRQEIFYPKIL